MVQVQGYEGGEGPGQNSGLELYLSVDNDCQIQNQRL